MHLNRALAILVQGPSHECNAARYGRGIQSEQFMVLRKDILNTLFGVQWADNANERLPEFFIDAIVTALVCP